MAVLGAVSLYWDQRESPPHLLQEIGAKMDTNDLPSNFQTTKRVIVLVDLAGYAKAFQSEGDDKMAAFIQNFYVECERVITKHEGVLIKFIGDACLAVFAPDQAKHAVDSVIELQSTVATLSKRYNLQLAMGANLHLSSAIEGPFGSASSQRHDIIGRGVNQTFLLGRGGGIRISEPVYRALPSSARSLWTKHKPPAVYHLT
jgi:class 3 adenylate cyclase